MPTLASRHQGCTCGKSRTAGHATLLDNMSAHRIQYSGIGALAGSAMMHPTASLAMHKCLALVHRDSRLSASSESITLAMLCRQALSISP